MKVRDMNNAQVMKSFIKTYAGLYSEMMDDEKDPLNKILFNELCEELRERKLMPEEDIEDFSKINEYV